MRFLLVVLLLCMLQAILAPACSPVKTGCANCATTATGDCDSCLPGYDIPTASGCTPCAAGMYSPGGNLACVNCAVGTWSAATTGSCTPCGAGMTTSGPQKTLVTDCYVVPLNCQILLSATACGTCKAGFSLSPTSTGSTCLPTIDFCNTYNGSECSVCSTGFYLSADKKTCTGWATTASSSPLMKAVISFMVASLVLFS